MVNPLHVKRSKELDDNLQTKNDKKDSMVIAKLIKDGRFSYPRILRDVDAELRVGSTYRANLTEELGAIKNRLIRWLDRYFPEFRQVFPSFGKMALAVLECTPFPSEVVGKSSEELLSLYREVDGLKSPQLPKTKKLMEVAASSIGITEGRVMARMELATLLRNYHQVVANLEIVTSELTELIHSSVEYEILSSVPGMGDATIVDLLAEIGSFSNYQDARQLLKLAGLTLRENSSGKMQGQKRISKRGRRKLRALLFKVMMPILRINDAFRALHEYYTTRTINPLRKKQSIVVLCGKLLKILHSICMKQVKFDGSKMKADISCLQEAA
jgi:transposase